MIIKWTLNCWLIFQSKCPAGVARHFECPVFPFNTYVGKNFRTFCAPHVVGLESGFSHPKNDHPSTRWRAPYICLRPRNLVRILRKGKEQDFHKRVANSDPETPLIATTFKIYTRKYVSILSDLSCTWTISLTENLVRPSVMRSDNVCWLLDFTPLWGQS